MKRMTVISSVAIMCLVVSTNSKAQKSYCSGFEIPLEIGSSLKLKESGHNLSFMSATVGRLILENQTGKPLKQAALRISYLDGHGNTLFAIPYVGRYGPPAPYIFTSFLANIWTAAIAPGTKFALEGTNLLGTREIPKSAVVTEANLIFSDGSSVGSLDSIHEAFGDPVLSDLPDRFEFDASPFPLPDELRLSISIDARGRVVSVQFDSNSKLDEVAQEKIRSQVILWHFYPAIRHSYAATTDLNILLRFYRTDRPPLEPKCSVSFPDKFYDKYADVELRLEGSSQWSVWYGGHPAHGAFGGVEVQKIQASREPCNEPL